MKDLNFQVELYDEAPEDWNDFLLKSETGTIYNSKEYAAYAENVIGWKPTFFRLTDSNGNIVLQNLLLEYSPSITRVPSYLRNFYKKFRRALRWNYGPVTNSQESLIDFFDYLKNTKKNIYGITHPFLSIPDILFTKQKWSTFLIDLEKPKEEIYNNIEKHNGRKNIERSIERNVVVEEITEKSFEEYFNLLNRYKATPKQSQSDFYQTLTYWNLLKNIGFSGFLARKNGLPVGGLLFSFFNGYINEWGVARSPEDIGQNLYSQDLIKWRIIEWGVKNKMKYYDLSGFNPNTTSQKEEGIFRYKKKWGGKRYDYWIIKK